MRALRIEPTLCVSCLLCLPACPPAFDAIRVAGPRVSIDARSCTGCGACVPVCPVACIRPGSTPVAGRSARSPALALALGGHRG